MPVQNAFVPAPVMLMAGMLVLVELVPATRKPSTVTVPPLGVVVFVRE